MDKNLAASNIRYIFKRSPGYHSIFEDPSLPYTPWVALFGHTVFLRLLTGFVLKKNYSFKKEPPTQLKPAIEKMNSPVSTGEESKFPTRLDNNLPFRGKTGFRKPK